MALHMKRFFRLPRRSIPRLRILRNDSRTCGRRTLEKRRFLSRPFGIIWCKRIGKFERNAWSSTRRRLICSGIRITTRRLFLWKATFLPFITAFMASQKTAFISVYKLRKISVAAAKILCRSSIEKALKFKNPPHRSLETTGRRFLGRQTSNSRAFCHLLLYYSYTCM